MACLALDEDGPTVIESPPNSLCFVNDLWQRYVTDMGIAGRDRGEGGRYLFLPPGYDGDLLLAIAAATAIARTEAPVGGQAVALTVFVVIGALGPGTPVVLYFALQERSRHLLDGLRVWMERNNSAIMAVLCLVLAAKLLGDSVSDLSS